MTDKRLDLVSIGSWTIFDHIYRMSRYPEKGATVTLDMPIDQLNKIYFGDCSANVAAVSAKLGLRVGLGMVVGEDFVTSGYRDHLERLGVDLSGVEVIESEKSGHSYLYFDSNGDGFCLSHLGIAQNQQGWTVPEQIIRVSRAVVVNEQFSEYTLSAIRLARSIGITTAINGMVGTAGMNARAFLEQADLLFIARDELTDLLSYLELTDVEALHEWGPELIFVTLGQEGSRLYDQGNQYDIDIVPASTVVDTTGAGDAYVGGTLAAILKGYTPQQAGLLGSATASHVVEDWGCQTRLPSWSEVIGRLNIHRGEN